MKAPDPGMHRGAFRNALTGRPDANRTGMRMLLENDPNTYHPKTTAKRKKKRR